MGRTVSVTVVFTDLVGSTELSSRVGPADSERLRQAHFGVLRTALSEHGGTEVKNLGDGLMVVFPSVVAAVDGAVAMQQGIARHNRRAAQELQVRVGMSSGDAVTEDDDYFGETVVEAARLCNAAQGGEILATEVVALLARSAAVDFTPVGELSLKGLPRPVASVRVEWSTLPVASEVPMPPRLAAVLESNGVFVGRHEPHRSLAAAMDATLRGEQRTVFVSGEPGVGKTALLAEFASSVHRSGAAVLYGRCDEELAVPYQPWVEAIGHLVEHGADALLRDHVDSHGLPLSRLVPQVAARASGAAAGSSDPETERYLMFQAVCALLDAAGSQSPLLVVLDDLHWADAPTLAMLRHLAATPMTSPPLIVATYRDSDVDRGHPLVDTLATLRRQDGFVRIALEGLGADEIAELVHARLGQPLGEVDRDFAEALRQETAGNPFFTREILRDLAERAELSGFGRSGSGSVAIDPYRLPESVMEIVRQRVDRLGADVHRTLSAASIVGRDFDLGLLAEVLDESEDLVLDRLEVASAASIIGEVAGVPDRFTFAHALAQHTMLAELSGARARRLHRRVAEAIERRWPDDPGERVGELARHWLAAVVPVDAERAVQAVLLAGRRALDALAPDEALRWFREGLELIDEVPDPDRSRRGRMLVLLGTAQKQTGDPAYRATLLDAAATAREIGDTEALVDAALANNRGYHSNSGVTDDERVEVIEAALEAVGEEDSVERALLLATLCAESNVERTPTELQRIADDALAMARRLGDPRTISEVVSRTRVAVHFLDTLDQRVPLYQESRRLAEQVGDPVVVFHSAQALLWAGAARADMGVFDAQLATMVDISERIGQPILQWLTRYTQAMRAAIAGDLERSEALADQALEIGLASGQPDAATFWGGQVMRVRLMQGRLPELADLIAGMAAENSQFSVFRAVHAVAAVQTGDDGLARSLIEAERTAGFDATHEMQWATGMTLWTEVAKRLGHKGAAAELTPLLVPFESLTAFTGLTYGGPLSFYLGELFALMGERDRAEASFERSLAVSLRTGDTYLEAMTRVGRAGLALERSLEGDDAQRGRVRDEAGAARRAAEARGFGLVARDAAEMLEAVVPGAG